MNKQYIKPEINVIELELENVINVSPGGKVNTGNINQSVSGGGNAREFPFWED